VTYSDRQDIVGISCRRALGAGFLSLGDEGVSLARDGFLGRAGRAAKIGGQRNDFSPEAQQAGSFLRSYMQTRDLSALHAAVSMYRAALAADPNQAAYLHNLGVALDSLFSRTGDIDALTESVAVSRAAVAATPERNTNRPAYLSSLGDHLRVLFGNTGDLSLLEEAVSAHRAAIAATRADDPQRAKRLRSLGWILLTRYERTGDEDALSEAVAVSREAVTCTPGNSAGKAVNLVTLGNALLAQFNHTGDASALSDAIAAQRAAVSAAPAGNPERIRALTGLGTALQTQFKQAGDARDLTEAVAAHREIVAATAPGDSDRPGYLTNLGVALGSVYESSGDLDALAEAVSVHRVAVEATPAGHSLRPGRLSNLGNALWCAFERTGNADILADSLAARRAAVDATTPGHPGRPAFMSNLGTGLNAYFKQTGALEALTDAIAAHREAVSATPAGSPARLGRLLNLESALGALYDRTGDLGALSEAVAVNRELVAATPAGHLNQAKHMGNLGLNLSRLAERTGNLDALTEAVAVGRATVTATPAGHPQLAMRQSTLGNTLRALAERKRTPEVLGEAAAMHRAAVASTPDDHPDRVGHLGNLANCLNVWFEKIPDLNRLHEAIEAGRAAVTAAPVGHPERATVESTLGFSLYTLYLRTGDGDVLAEARELLAAAVSAPSARVGIRILAGRRLARTEIAAGKPQAALAAMETVISLLPILASRNLHSRDRQHRLGEVSGIGTQAASIALAAGRPERAVELLEAARGLLLAETMNARRDLSRLRVHAPELAQELIALRDQLADLDREPDEAAARHDEQQEQTSADHRRNLGRQWEALLSRIRSRPELGDFWMVPPVDRLRREARNGPIVFIIAGSESGDALILADNPVAPVRHVPLPKLSHKEATKQVQHLRFAFREPGVSDSAPMAPNQTRPSLRQVLWWLWDAVTGPVLTALGHTASPEPGQPWPRIWWCPVGVVAQLPLHAAGHHHASPATAEPAAQATVLDRMVSSYTPTIRALAYTRATLPAAETSPGASTASRTLIIAVPDAPNATALPGVQAEVDLLRPLLPGAVVLTGPQATHDTVLADLPRHPAAHFACHGISDWSDPDASHLLLHDHETQPLTIGHISRLDLPGAELAYLSACNTSDASPRLLDEAVHITAAFQLAGYRNVIGTLWPVEDRAASSIATEFYNQLTDGGRHQPNTDNAACALHHAIRAFRAAHRSPARWAAHIHVGP
jgi:hypothetical protein